MKRYNYIRYDEVKVFDGDFFTEEKALVWKDHLLNCYEAVRQELDDQLDFSCEIEFYINIALLQETFYDAIIGMRKIVSSDNNKIERPNSFKVAAYISYWWLRHKPACFHYGSDFDYNSDVRSKKNTPEDNKKLAWRIKHINEIVAVDFVLSFIFDFNKTLCDNRICNKIREHDDKSFNFNDFEQMRIIMIEKLIYYFCYRAIAPKVIEHILEAYTFHPAWELTAPHWGENEICEEGDKT